MEDEIPFVLVFLSSSLFLVWAPSEQLLNSAHAIKCKDEKNTYLKKVGFKLYNRDYIPQVSGEFYLPPSDKNDNNFNMSLTFVGPWNNRLPNIAVISPSGTKYGSRNDDGNLIAQKWSSNVSTLKSDKKKIILSSCPMLFFKRMKKLVLI